MSKKSKRPRLPKPDGVEPRPRMKGRQGPTVGKADGPQTLSDLARQLPTGDEFVLLTGTFAAMADREAVISHAALMDALLERAIRLNLSVANRDEAKAMFRDRGPLASLSDKIILAKALGVFGEEMKNQADCVRRIRNTFAHAIRVLNFSETLLEKEANRLDPRRMCKPGVEYLPDDTTPRGRFHESAMFINRHVMEYISIRYQALKAGSHRLPTPYESKFS